MGKPVLDLAGFSFLPDEPRLSDPLPGRSENPAGPWPHRTGLPSLTEVLFSFCAAES